MRSLKRLKKSKKLRSRSPLAKWTNYACMQIIWGDIWEHQLSQASKPKRAFLWSIYTLTVLSSKKNASIIRSSTCKLHSSGSKTDALSGRISTQKSFLKCTQNSVLTLTRCLKIAEKVSFIIASEASYVYILSGQKLIKNAKNGPFWRVFENLKLAVKQCYQTGQFQ